jgi:hypothetical protein
LLRAGAPLLFLDALGESLAAGTMARFRPTAGLQGRLIRGRFSCRPLATLEFPWNLLDWPEKAAAVEGRRSAPYQPIRSDRSRSGVTENDARLWQWLTNRFFVTESMLPAFFGASVGGEDAFACSPGLWQACIYYRFIDRRVGAAWWIGEVEVWARRFLPLAFQNGRLLRRALWSYQALLSAAGLLSLPNSKGSARVVADFQTLGRTPDLSAAQRLVEYRRTLLWERE